MEQFLLVDYENVQKIELKKLPEDVHVVLALDATSGPVGGRGLTVTVHGNAP